MIRPTAQKDVTLLLFATFCNNSPRCRVSLVVMNKMKGNFMMKRIFLIPVIALSVLAANAAPLKRADVAADPSVLVHIDFDGLRATSIGKAILAQLSQPDVDTKLSAIKGIFSFDPRTQLHGATLCTAGKTTQGGVLIVYADFDSNRVLNLGMLAPGFHSITNGNHVIYSWIDEKKKGKEDDEDGPPHIFAAIRDNRIILGKSESWLISELNVLDGTEPSMAGDNSTPGLSEAGNGVFVQAVVRRFDFGGDSPNAAIFKMSKLARLEVGERNNNLTATLEIDRRRQRYRHANFRHRPRGFACLAQTSEGQSGRNKARKRRFRSGRMALM